MIKCNSRAADLGSVLLPTQRRKNGRKCAGQVCIAGIQVDRRGSVFAGQNTSSYEICRQSPSRNKIGHNGTVRGHGKPIGAVISCRTIAQPGLIPSPDLYSGADVRHIHNENLVRLFCAGGTVQYHISTLISRDQSCGIIDCLLHVGGGWGFFERLLLSRYRIGNICPGVAQINTVIAVQQNVIYGLYTFCRGRYPQSGELHIDRVAQQNGFEQR